AGGKQGAFRLIFVEWNLHESFERRAFVAARKSLGKRLGTKGRIAYFGEVLADIVATTDFVLGSFGVGQKLLERVDRCRQKQTFIVEVLADFACQGHRNIASGAEADLALAAVMKDELAVGRLEAGLQRILAVAAAQFGERE